MRWANPIRAASVCQSCAGIPVRLQQGDGHSDRRSLDLAKSLPITGSRLDKFSAVGLVRELHRRRPELGGAVVRNRVHHPHLQLEVAWLAATPLFTCRAEVVLPRWIQSGQE